MSNTNDPFGPSRALDAMQLKQMQNLGEALVDRVTGILGQHQIRIDDAIAGQNALFQTIVKEAIADALQPVMAEFRAAEDDREELRTQIDTVIARLDTDEQRLEAKRERLDAHDARIAAIEAEMASFRESRDLSIEQRRQLIDGQQRIEDQQQRILDHLDLHDDGA